MRDTAAQHCPLVNLIKGEILADLRTATVPGRSNAWRCKGFTPSRVCSPGFSRPSVLRVTDPRSGAGMTRADGQAFCPLIKPIL